MRQLRALLADLRLELADAKTRLVYLDNEGEGSFDFLGFHHQMVESFSKPGWHFLARWPSARATQAARTRICELTERRLLLLPLEDVVANLNRFLTAWAGYFRRGNSTTQFHKLDLYTAERLARWIGKRHKPNVHSPTATGACARNASSVCDHSSGGSGTAPRVRPGEGCR